jgi:hypothetical protein
MATQAEKLKKGIETLTWRIAALAERLPNESSDRGDSPRETVRQINEYVRAKAALKRELEELSVGDNAVAQSNANASNAADQINLIAAVQHDHTPAEESPIQQSWWKRN